MKQMTFEEAKKIIEMLTDGVDPRTGELLPSDSCLHYRDCVRALSLATNALEQMSVKEAKDSLPSNAGLPWTDSMDTELLKQYRFGKSVIEIAMKFQRTPGAITSRLMKLGEFQPSKPSESA